MRLRGLKRLRRLSGLKKDCGIYGCGKNSEVLVFLSALSVLVVEIEGIEEIEGMIEKDWKKIDRDL